MVPLYGDEFEELPYGDEGPSMGSELPGEASHGAAEEGRLGVSQGLRWYMRSVHVPLLRLPAVKAGVLALFAGLFMLSAAMLPRLER